jgi:hypothetical protein
MIARAQQRSLSRSVSFGWSRIAWSNEIVDLEKLPWPWPDDSVQEVLLSHVLEHLGGDTVTYLGIIKELYRVCHNGAQISIVVPHPRHDHFLSDPTHVRPITADSLALFSQSANRQCMAMGIANTPLGIYLGVDFAIHSINFTLDEPWRGRHERKEITESDLRYAARHYNNVIRQI